MNELIKLLIFCLLGSLSVVLQKIGLNNLNLTFKKGFVKGVFDFVKKLLKNKAWIIGWFLMFPTGILYFNLISTTELVILMPLTNLSLLFTPLILVTINIKG